MSNQGTDEASAINGRRKSLPGRVQLPEVQPWPEVVDGKILLERLVSELKRFLVFPKWVAETLALWIVHTYAYQLREVTTYLAIESPEKECGKSTLLTVLSRFVNRPAVSSNISSSAFFHAIEELEPTLLIDEADTNLRTRRELRGIFNGGYTKPTAYVWRVMYEGRDERVVEGANGGREPVVRSSRGTLVRYSVWCPKAIASIGRVDETLASRCIVIGMQRKTEVEECERLKKLEVEELKEQCARFVLDHTAEIASAEPAIPKGLTNRAADIWEPLLALADLAGGQWPEQARQAAEALTVRAKRHSPIGALLLDIFLIFTMGQKDRLFTRDIVEALNESGDRPWAELKRGKVVNETWLARQLRPYEIGPRTIRAGEQVAKGYVEADFKEAFKRYIPRAQIELLKADLAARTEGNQADPPNSPA